MVGDSLTVADCGLLVKRLQRTQQCFSCAHGRPTMVPLGDMRALRQLLFNRRTPAAEAATRPAVSAFDSASPVGGTAQLCDIVSKVLMG